MASYLFINTLHVCFESVLAMDNAGMVAMFESLVDTGLKGFLGCPAVIHEADLLEFFANGSVRDGLVVSTVNGVTVEFSEQLFAETFELPVEGLTDLSEIPKDLVFDARSIISLSVEPVSMSAKKKEMAIEFRLLFDILAKTISVKAGSFDAITQEKFLIMAAITCGVRINWNRLLFNIFKDMVTPGSRQAKGYAIQISLLLENVPNLELGESSEFPSSKVLTEKTVHWYIVLNDKVGMEVVTAEPRVKKTPVKRAASKKRPAADADAEEVVKKKRTTKSKSVSAKETLETLPVEAVPLQMIAPIPVVPTEQPPVPKRKTQKRKRRLILGSDDEIVDSEPVVGGSIVGEAAAEVVDDTADKDVEPVVESVGIYEAETVVVESVSLPAVAVVLNEGISTADEVDIIIEQVIAETAQIDTDMGDQDVVTSEVGDKTAGTADEFELWFNLSSEEIQARLDADRPIETASDTDEEFIADQVFGTGVEKMETDTVEQTADEAMSLEDILMTIPVDCPLPSASVEVTKIILGGTISIPGVNEGDWYKASLPKISAADKGKAPLLERDPAKGNPIQEQFSLILADIEVLVMLREQIIDEVENFFNSFSLKRLATLKIDDSYCDKEVLILWWAETDSTRVALNRRTYILTKYRELLIRKFLEVRKINFTPGEGSSATDLKVMEMLSDLHLFAVEELKEQCQASCSKQI
ncbi:dystroglycan-like [Dorcoceras hygrometricum]|uniref:Dystroglycan-like n=1 Tax=Dorcoceras hygrometricum TaxID=472368 RepID=A0A2Z7C9T1_9LAMI|nr:dystroglycan-like [Dorcoceras hygrometricum]